MIEIDLFPSRRVRLVRQSEVAECGIACLSMLSIYYGRPTSLEELRKRSAPSLRGTTLRGIVTMAEGLGFESRALKLEADQLEQLNLPVILHWDLKHFIVLERHRRGRWLIHDPASSTKWISEGELSRSFTGVALELSPQIEFTKPERRTGLGLRSLGAPLKNLGGSLAQLIALSLLMQCYLLAAPYFIQVSVDQVLPAQDLDLLYVLALGFGLLLVFYLITHALRSAIMLYVGTKLGFDLSVAIAKHLFRLPIEYFEKRHTGDVLSRFHSIVPIQRAVTHGAIGATIDGLFGVLTFVMMWLYSPFLALISLGALLLYLLFRALTYRIQFDAENDVIVQRALEQTTMIETLRGMKTLRIYNQEDQRRSRWTAALSRVTNADVRGNRIKIWQSIANKALFGSENILVVVIAISMIVEASGFSLGMLFAFFSYKSQFTERTIGFVDQVVLFKMLRLHFERVGDIATQEVDRKFSNGPLNNTSVTAAGAEKIKSLELVNVSYRYSEFDPFVLKGINLSINGAEHVAITGPSGSGKSTLLKIVLGLIEPTDGELRVNGLPLQTYGVSRYHEQLSSVLSEETLFSGSVAENISLFDTRYDFFELQRCASAAAIDGEIMRMPMRYETLVGDMGSSLSGGQRQRLMLARALYRKPNLLIMDEGTAHLDAANEEKVSAAISSLGIMRIVVAHRGETLKLADRQLFMAGGQLHERSLEKLQLTLPETD